MARFFQALARLDERLAREAPLGWSERQIFQGPIADALTHVGQIAMLRRMFGSPVRGESYLKAEIVAGRVGPEQQPGPLLPAAVRPAAAGGRGAAAAAWHGWDISR